MFKKFRSVFHTAIIAAVLLTGCGYKGSPVYKEGDKTKDFNATQDGDRASRM